ncbi:exonuclease RNase T and DNA polymerase III [Kineococcus radiotolerans]|uniref:Exonuclease RNase T and DNA polymerase III n=1 Tax=Kineococcus radiotolerans (strain ATCC BAA-149 / DSM 14245 / SRS30216) TaxID=266940 RepID=A6W8W5_KINRD|nr:exonuclease RNase T and DNA polymerase III [Kineococcus radiotolerans]ABS03254.1 Exonuclease RNase T and DNA polymerase III [Kineococcus radiotolerans SRS30216 = ATCC BAA-149]
MSKRPLVFFDTETTGLGPGRQAWEIALVRREPDGTERPLEFFLPIEEVRAEPGALDIGRYYARHPHGIAISTIPAQPPFTTPKPADAPRPVPQEPGPVVLAVPKAARLLAQWTSGATIVGANPAFDVQILERLVRTDGHAPRWHYRTRDVEAMAVGFIGDEDLGGLAACAAALDVTIDPDLEHTAMGDVRTVMAIYDAVILGERLPDDQEPARPQGGA